MKKIFTLVFISTLIISHAQMGINTNEIGNELLKINKSNISGDVLKISNEEGTYLVFNSDNNIGINDANPGNVFVLGVDSNSSNTGIQLKNGATKNAVATSDTTGKIHWETKKFIEGNFPDNQSGVLIPEIFYYDSFPESIDDVAFNLGPSITLTKGKWIVYVDFFVDLYNLRNIKYTDVIRSDYSLICSMYLTKTTNPSINNRLSTASNTLIFGSPNQIKGVFSRGTNSTRVKGKFLVEVNDAAFKTLYLSTNCVVFGFEGDPSVGVNVRPFVNFDKNLNTQFYAVPLSGGF